MEKKRGDEGQDGTLPEPVRYTDSVLGEVQINSARGLRSMRQLAQAGEIDGWCPECWHPAEACACDYGCLGDGDDE